MLKEVLMPKLGQTVEQATIETWHKAEGDTVDKGDVLLEITTDKATLEVEAYATGTLKKRIYEPGATVPVNAIIAYIGDPDDAVTDAMVQKARADAADAAQAAAQQAEPEAAAAAETPAPAPAAAAEPAAAPPVAQAAPPPPPGRLFASPRARRVAAERKVPLQVLRGSGPNGRIVERDVLAHAEQVDALRVSPTALELAAQRGVDLTKLKGTGTDGRIMKADVEAAPVAAAPAPMPLGRRVPLTAMRRIVAQRMALSKSTIPHFTLTMDVDMTELSRFRRERNDAGGPKLSFNDLILRATTLAFAAVPEMNAAWADGAIVYRGAVNIGLAVALEGGLIVPVVRDCQDKALDQIAEATQALIDKARNKRLTPDEYEGGCLTVSNLGMFGVDTVTPIINPGEVAILGVGRIAPRPVVVGDGIFVRQMTTLVLACDHRIVDGAIAARFLQALAEAIDNPASLA